MLNKPFTEAMREYVDAEGISLDQFYAYMPTHQYLFIPTRELWPATSVNQRLEWPQMGGRKVKPSDWLDQFAPIEQMVWHPGEPQLVVGRVMQIAGWVRQAGATVFNKYVPPPANIGDPAKSQRWRDHIRRIYPDNADHIEQWLAHRVQRPGEKINHAIVLGGMQGIGKDTLLEPVKVAIGQWNCQAISPVQLLGRFNGYAASVMLLISEARDLGEIDRFKFYDHSKAYITAPPDFIRVDEKNLREHYVANVCGVVVTTNHKTDGLYLPADDRRHFVAWSDCTRDDFAPDYWQALYRWYADGGNGHVAAYLRTLDLSSFDPKAPPPKTAAFWAIVAAGEAPESGELRDVIDGLGNPAALTLDNLIASAENLRFFDLALELKDRKQRRSIPHKLERVDYVPVRNPDATDGLFKLNGRRQAVYGRRRDPISDQIRAVRALGESV